MNVINIDGVEVTSIISSLGHTYYWGNGLHVLRRSIYHTHWTFEFVAPDSPIIAVTVPDSCETLEERVMWCAAYAGLRGGA